MGSVNPPQKVNGESIDTILSRFKIFVESGNAQNYGANIVEFTRPLVKEISKSADNIDARSEEFCYATLNLRGERAIFDYEGSAYDFMSLYARHQLEELEHEHTPGTVPHYTPPDNQDHDPERRHAA
ncbi:hypothetical protein CL619_04005 [archaeon]|jgi:hypothetical protein|nr:hypothetical protein [archaeon]|tara:strand:+ start:2154 stop:2534 length:381 start_codon:yes stop_codon:yes gene_type:complete